LVLIDCAFKVIRHAYVVPSMTRDFSPLCATAVAANSKGKLQIAISANQDENEWLEYTNKGLREVKSEFARAIASRDLYPSSISAF
jgi:hypothetical protein